MAKINGKKKTNKTQAQPNDKNTHKNILYFKQKKTKTKNKTPNAKKNVFEKQMDRKQCVIYIRLYWYHVNLKKKKQKFML